MQLKQQSRQTNIKAIYQAAEKLLQRENQIQCIWPSTKVTLQQQTAAKKTARNPTRQKAPLKLFLYQSRFTTTRRIIEVMKKSHTLSRKVEDFITKLNRALSDKHIKKLYDSLKKTEAKILIQLRTIMSRINKYLHSIDVIESSNCACDVEKEDVKHFLFRCIRWIRERAPLRQYFTARDNALSRCLENKAPSDPEDWSSDMTAVRATIQFALDTGRLDYQLSQW